MEGVDSETAMLEALERDFQQVLVEMTGDQSIERFRKEFQKLYDTLKKSHENERILLQKSTELKNHINKSAGMIRTAITLNQNDATQINLLLSELENSKNLIAQMKEKEENSKAVIKNLEQMNRNLQEVIRDSENAQTGNTNKIKQLEEAITSLKHEKDSLEKECQQKQEEKLNHSEELKGIHNTKSNLESEIKKVRSLLRDTKARLKKDEKRAKEHEIEVGRIKAEIEEIRLEKDKELGHIEELKIEKDGMKEKDDKCKIDIERTEKRKDQQREKNVKLKETINALKREYGHLMEERVTLDKTITKKSGEVNEKEVKFSQLLRKKDKKVDEMQRVTNEKEESERMHFVLRKQIEDLQREVEQARKSTVKERDMIDNLLKDQNSIRINFSKLVKQNERQDKSLKSNKEKCNVLVDTAYKTKKEIDIKMKQIHQSKLENEKIGKEALKAMQKYHQLREEIKLKENLISEFQKKTQDTENKLKQQQKLYEAVRSDRNLYSKHLTETQDEIAEIKLRYKIVMHQIAQLKEELNAKEKALTQQYQIAKDYEKRHQNFEKENDRLKKVIDDRVQSIKNYKNEIGKLQFIIKESESKRESLKTNYEQVVSERDILGTQLIRKNDELALIYEKIKMQQNTLARGEAEYRERLSDIEILNHTIKDLHRELRIYKSRALTLDEYHDSIHQLNKELVEEKLKVKALSEELENPKSIHRWRKLGGTDCDTYEMISKIEKLQKRLISKTEEVVSKDLKVNTQEQTIKNLKQVMTTQPGLAEAEMISYYQQTIKSKTRKLKALAAELNMYQAQSNEYKYEIERLRADHKEKKREFYEIKRRDQLIREQEEKDRGHEQEDQEQEIQLI